MKKLYLLISFLISFSFATAQTYCIPTGGSSSTSYYLSQATLTGSTALGYTASGYQVYVDNSAQTVQTYAGAVMPIYLKQNTGTGKFYIYIDWNNDGDFDDADENPVATTVYTGDISTTITVPATVALGNYRIRVESAYITPALPVSACGPNDWGNFVDFTINVTNPPSCIPPTALVSSGISSASATISWSAPSSVPANGYEVYTTTSTTPPTAATVPTLTNITTNSATVTGLTPAAINYVYVRSNCSSTDKSGWSQAVAFLTNCVTVTNFSENFDAVSSPDLPVCWEQIGTTGYIYTQDYDVIAGVNSLYLSGSTFSGNALLKLPAVSTLQLGTYRLKFKLRADYIVGGKMEVGYLANSADPDSFVALDSFTANSTTVPDNVVVNSIYAPPGVENLVFRQTDTPGISVLIDDVIYELTPSCPEPTAVVTSNISTTTVDIAWNAPTSAPADGYQIYYSTTNVLPTDTTTPNISGITSTSTTVSGLTPSTTYYMYVRSSCSTTDKSPWTSAQAFTTSCNPITTLPWTENFDALTTIGSNILPPCWKSTGAGPDYSTANAVTQTFNDPRSAPNYVTVYYPTDDSYLWSPGFTLTAGQSYDFSFYWAGDDTSGWEGDVFVNNSQSEAGATQLGSSFVTAGTTTNSSYTKSKSIFVPTTTGTYYFAVKTFTSSFAPYYLGFDDFSLQISSNCSEPTALTSSNITTTTADVAWTAPTTAPANGYQIYYSTSNSVPTAATVLDGSNSVSTTTTSASLSGLNTSSIYYFWVRSVCSSTEYSGWSNAGIFATVCTAINVPYTQDFSTATIPNIPNCTTVTNDGSGNVWQTASSGINGNTLKYGYNTSNPANTWFYTIGINMTAGTTYYIGYKYAASSSSYTEKLQVKIGTANNAAAMTTLIADYPAITSTTPAVVQDQTFTPTVSGVYYVGFQAYSDANQFNLYLDDITVKDVASLSTNETTVKENLVNIYPNPFTDFIRISDVKDVVSISIVDLSGRLVKTVKPAREINLGDLKTGMYLINLKMKNGSVQTVKAIKK